MAPLLQNLLGNGSKDREAAESLRAAIREMQQERARNEALFEKINAATDRLKELGEPIAKAGSDVDSVSGRLQELERRFLAMTELSAKLMNLDERAEGLERGQQRAETQVVDALEQAKKVREVFEDFGQKVDLALGLKEKLGSFLEIERPFQQLRGEAEALRGQVEGTGEHLARLREQHDRLLDAHKLATSKMEAVDRRREELSRDLQDKERRVASVENAVRGMDGVQRTVEDVRRDIGSLKALGDVVGQKVAALEAQREAVEHALGRANHLDQAMRQIDAGIRQQQEHERSLGALQNDVDALRARHEAVLERSDEISQLQHDTDERTRAARMELVGMQDEMKKTVERFDFESRGLESVSQRVADLRSAVTDCENRLKGVTESSQKVGELDSRTRTIAAGLQTISEEIGQVDAELEKLRGMRRDLDALSDVATQVRGRVNGIEASQPALEAALNNLRQLDGAHALVKDSLEQTRIAHAEVEKMRGAQQETRTWLTGTEQALGEMRWQVVELRELAPTIDAVQKQAQRVQESVASIETRREFVEDLHRRLGELSTLSGQLDDRGRQLQARMEGAEQRFVALGEHAGEAERLSQSIGVVTAGLTDAERRSEKIARDVAAIGSRCESVEALAESTRHLKAEIEQRHGALASAAKDLQKSSALRQEAATSAQQLEEQVRRLAAEIAAADGSVTKLDALSANLEDRSAKLQAVRARLDQFEERLTRWDLVEQQVGRSLEQIIARQGTVESLQGDLDRMFGMAEKTSGQVREITSAQREIEESRTMLTDVMGRLKEVRDTVGTLDERQRQMGKAEERLARSEALLLDVRSSLESLQGQKAIVDQAVEKAGSLQFLLKQADAMIDGLREEREMSTRVKSAMDHERHDDDGGHSKAA